MSITKDGSIMEYTAPSGGVTVDVPLLIGSLLVVPQTTEVEGDPFNACVGGLLRDAKKKAGVAWTEGLLLYWKASTSEFSTLGADGPPVGTAAADAASGDVLGDVRLQGVAADTGEGAQTAIADLVDNSGGTADGTLADSNNAVTGVDGTGSNAASKADVDARLVTIADNTADLAAKVNAILAVMRTRGDILP